MIDTEKIKSRIEIIRGNVLQDFENFFGDISFYLERD